MTLDRLDRTSSGRLILSPLTIDLALLHFFLPTQPAE